MAIAEKFVALVMSAVTAFTITYDTPNVRPAPIIEESKLQYQIDDATQLAQSSGLSVGIAVIDRAKKNQMKTNDEAAHREFVMESAGRLPILLHAARVDPEVGKGSDPDISAMMQSSSGEATERLWEKHGANNIIMEMSRRYNLQETSTGYGWRDVTSSAVDIGRMYRRFLDDKDVSAEAKRYVISLLRETSLTVVGEDFSFGIPQAFDVPDMADENKSVGWVQGWSPSGSDHMMRTSTGVVGIDQRYIIIITGEVTGANISDETANVAINEVASTLVGSTTDQAGRLFVEEGDNQEEEREIARLYRNARIDELGEDFIGERKKNDDGRYER